MNKLALSQYTGHYIDQDDIDAIVNILKESELLTTGKQIGIFEQALVDYLNQNCQLPAYMSVCSNGTAALHLAYMGLNIGKGDVVIIPSMTFLATASAVLMAGAHIVFCDVDKLTGLISIDKLGDAFNEAKQLGSPRAVVCVHLNGQMCEMRPLLDFAREHGLYLIEDACHALGGWYIKDKTSYAMANAMQSDAACFSFHPAKAITTGEGGGVLTRNHDTKCLIDKLRSHGIERNAMRFQKNEQAVSKNGVPNPWYYEMQQLGYNYRINDLQCALGTSQLKKLDRFIAKRKLLVAHYIKRLKDLDPHIRHVYHMQDQEPAFHLMVVLINFEFFKITRAQLMHDLKEKNIGTQVHYIPLYRHPFWKSYAKISNFKNTESYYHQVLSLPLMVSMEQEDVDYVVDH
ncbi:MAG: aminotransferase class I/II-fold pyridoxal phosphate-dependent enzyme, partial [Pseudomonadota bacterium]